MPPFKPIRESIFIIIPPTNTLKLILNEANYSVYEFDDKAYLGLDQDSNLDTLALNMNNLVNPWDDVTGFRGFG